MDVHLLDALSKGTVLGLAAGFSPGPLTLLVISETLRHGLRAGMKVSLAPILTDLPIIALAALLLDRLSSHPAALGGIALLGGALLGVVVTLVKKRTIWTLLAAPAGTILGSLIARLLPISGAGLPFSALLALAGGLLLSVLGGYRSRGSRIPCLKVLQPIAGAMGGLLFGLLGFLLMYRVN